jgi:hypothetical protein
VQLARSASIPADGVYLAVTLLDLAVTLLDAARLSRVPAWMVRRPQRSCLEAVLQSRDCGRPHHGSLYDLGQGRL